MKHKPGVEKSPCKVISFKNFKDKKVNKVTSTIAAIIAIKIEQIESKIEILRCYRITKIYYF